MAVDVEKFKQAFRVDGDDDNTLIQGYLKTAENFIKSAVGKDDANGTFYSSDGVAPLLETSTLALAGTYYEYRMSLTDVRPYAVNLTVNSIIGQLRGLYASWEASLNA